MGCVKSNRLDFLGFLGTLLDFLQQALLAAKSDAQRPKTRIRQSELQKPREYILNTSRGDPFCQFNRRCLLCSLLQ